jgi:hypothetical protein
MMMRVLVRRLSIGLALVLGVAALAWQSFSGDPTPEADADRRLPELRVTLGASRKLVTTAGMSAADQAGFDRSGNFLQPHLLVLTLPDSRRIELTSRSTLVRLDGLEHDASRDEIVIELLVRRPLEPCRYQEAVADMLATIRSMGVEPHARMIEMTREGDIPGREKRSGPLMSHNAKGVDLKDGTRVHCTLTPDPERGWFVLYIISSNYELWPSVIEREGKERFHRQRAMRGVLSSQPLLPAAVQIEEMFPLAGHHIDRSVRKGKGDDRDLREATFITQAYFADRYHLRMEAPVELDDDDVLITGLRGEPTFVLREIAAMERSNGRLSLDPVWRQPEHRFDLAAWNKVIAAQGDFSAIGIEIDPTPVPDARIYIDRLRAHTAAHSLVREARDRAVRSAGKFLPAAVQIERIIHTKKRPQNRLRTNHSHSFDNFVFTGKDSDFQKTFITEAYFGDLYQLTMQAGVELDKNDKTITRLRGEPTFVLRQFESVEWLDDGHTAKVQWRHEHRFDLDAWNKVVAAGGDFSVIGITIDQTPVPVSKADRAHEYFSHHIRSRGDCVSLLDGVESGDEN